MQEEIREPMIKSQNREEVEIEDDIFEVKIFKKVKPTVQSDQF